MSSDFDNLQSYLTHHGWRQTSSGTGGATWESEAASMGDSILRIPWHVDRTFVEWTWLMGALADSNAPRHRRTMDGRRTLEPSDPLVHGRRRVPGCRRHRRSVDLARPRCSTHRFGEVNPENVSDHFSWDQS